MKRSCPVCHVSPSVNLGEHILKKHGDEQFQRAVLKAKESGMSDPDIGETFGITFKQLERIITEKYGINISVLKRPKRITHWEPRYFKEETTTVWSYKQRGNWATHNGRYRGNWSPYIPRNVILKYSKQGDVILDYFVGGGTTAVEAKLLGRKCIARDINPACIGLSLENLNFNRTKKLINNFEIYEPEVSLGDARDLSDIPDNSIDLICAHPPYAGIINYSSKVEGDMSKLSIAEFLQEIEKVSRESYRVLKPGRKCAILIGDTRKRKHVVPIGFQLINVFLKTGFKLKELIIKRQHNCKTTGFWTDKSIKYNFLLLAHEYLPIFEKPTSPPHHFSVKEDILGYSNITLVSKKPQLKKIEQLETTTVWIFPESDYDKNLNKNVIDRYSEGKGYETVDFTIPEREKRSNVTKKQKAKQLLFIKSSFLNNRPSRLEVENYLVELKKLIVQKLPSIKKGGFLVILTKDVRIAQYIEPLAERIVDILTFDSLWLKEIVIVTKEKTDIKAQNPDKSLEIVHQYLLIYERTE